MNKFKEITEEILTEGSDAREIAKIQRQVVGMITKLIKEYDALEQESSQETGVGGHKVDKAVRKRMDEVDNNINVLEDLQEQLSDAFFNMK